MPDIEKFADFGEICRKICLNIPENCTWQWDEQRKMALIKLDKFDSELVYFPLIKEFKHHWNFSSPEEAENLTSRLINSEYGLMPGQTFFVSRPIEGIVLFVAWWPWGVADRISMRVGLFPLEAGEPCNGISQVLLRKWLRIAA